MCSMRKLAVLPLLILPLFAFADCRDQLQGWADVLQPTLKLDLEHSVCKANPADPKQVLAALTFTDNVDENNQGDYDLVVLVANAADGKIIGHHYQHAAISSDAVQFEELTLDTGRYQLAPQRRAFGIRVTYEGSSRVNPYGGTSLSLYVLDGAVVRRVMDKLMVNQSTGEWDGTCTGDFVDTTRTLSIGEMGKKGWARLVVDEKVAASHDQAKGDDCQSIDKKPVTAKFTLDYDGSQYGVPQGLTFQ